MERLKEFLEDSDWTQDDLAKEVGVSQPTVSDWLKGKMRPSLDNLVVLSRVTHLSLEDLVTDCKNARTSSMQSTAS